MSARGRAGNYPAGDSGLGLGLNLGAEAAAQPGAAPGRTADATAGPPLGAICTELALPLSAVQQRQLLDYLALLERWNHTHNLTAVREPAAMVTLHLADCLAAAAAVQRHASAHRVGRILDVGSGGGLPGVVLAIMRPQATVVCVDAVAKKAAFVRQVAGTLQLPNLQAAHSRVERLGSEPFDLITARAFSALNDLVAHTRHLLAAPGVWAAMKGVRPQDEIAALPPEVEVFHVEPLAVPGLTASRCIVWMRPR